MALDSVPPPRRDSCPATIVDRLRDRASRHPDRRAFTFLAEGDDAGTGISYGEIDRRARELGGRLQALGLTGARALLLYPPGLDYLTAFFGCLYAGVVGVPAYPPRPNRPMPRLEAIATDARASAVLTTRAIRVDAQPRFPEAPGLVWLETDHAETIPFGPWSEPAILPEGPAFLQYTSGSTSSPRGVVVTHANLVHNSARIQRCFGTSAESRGVFWLPLYHDMGLIGGVVQTLYCGGSSVLLSPVAFLQRPVRWLEAIARSRATISGGPDFAYDLCIRKVTAEQRAGLDLSSWTLAFNGAEPIRPETLRRFADVFGPCGFRREAFYPCYGLAESTLIVSGGAPHQPPALRSFQGDDLDLGRVVECADDDQDRRVLVGCGTNPADQTIVIVDPETLAPSPPDRVGEIWVSSPSVAVGYWNRPEETGRIFRARLPGHGETRYLRTGDLGFLKDGELFVTGRLKDLVVIRGRNYAPHDLEWTVAESDPALRPSSGAAFSVDVSGQERLVIVQEVDRHVRNGQAHELIGTIRQAVASHHELEVFAVALLRIGTIPKTSSGKIQRLACREAFLAHALEEVARWTQEADDDDASAPPLSPPPSEAAASAPPSAESIQSWLSGRLAQRLGIAPHDLDTQAPFVSFGMSSAQAVALSGELEEWLGRRLSPTLIYNYPTVSSLARHLAGTDGPASPPRRPPLRDHDEIRARALAEVEGMSDEESNLLIAREIAKFLR